MMAIGGNINIAVQFPIYAAQQIQIERRADALGIVIGSLKNGNLLFQIDPDQQRTAGQRDQRYSVYPDCVFSGLRLSRAG